MRLSLCSALAFVFLAAPADGDDKTEADLKALAGKWKVEKAELSGKNILDELKDLKFEIRDGGKYTAQIGEKKDEGTFTIDPAKKPKELNINPNGAPKTGKAIYKIDGDTLTVCYQSDPDGTRPTKFETKADSTEMLIVYKRTK